MHAAQGGWGRGWLGSTLLAVMMASGAAHAQTTVQTLDDGWQFRLAAGDSHAKEHAAAGKWHAASVPGTVQTDLLAAKLLPDPYYRDNEAKVQWVGLSNWDYQLHFKVDAATLARENVQLVFDGLDTFAEVSLNGQPLGNADNMFRAWRLSAKQALHVGDNVLDVHLQSPIAKLLPWLLKQPYALPGEFDSPFGDEPVGKQTSNYVRKAAYQYGWDWGPRIVTEGIWLPVHLDSWDGPRVSGFHIAQNKISAEAAQLQVQVDVSAAHSQPLHLHVDALDPSGHTAASIDQDITVDSGTQTLSLPLRIANPRRWYPAGYGAQDMYAFKVSLRDGSTEIYSGQHQVGLRSVELRREKDAWGKSFAFVINGIPVFAKGADMIPFDSFPPRASEAQMLQVLQSARDANMNMVRIWGGGYYMPDSFYEMTDKLGLMVFQDFMFGGAIPPTDPDFIANTRQEAVEQVQRLRDHASIVLWCGNNEVETGWEAWGDRIKFAASIPPAERDQIVTGMVNLFGNVLRDVVTRYDGEVPYWSSTPSTDFDGPANVNNDGDVHYWDVWSGSAKPVEEYLNVTPRFQSEYGLQSFPDLRTIDAFTEAADRTPESTVMRAHQKYDKGNGNKRLLLYIERSYGTPKDFPAFVYLSQAMQAHGIELAAEHLRASRPQAMGSLYWQLNDVWPGASWSSIDYYGRWKALQFHAKRFYAPLLIAALRNNGNTSVAVVSDRTSASTLHWRLRVMDFSGHVLHESSADLNAPALSSSKLGTFSDADLLKGADPHASVAAFELFDGDQLVSRNLVYFDEAKNLALPTAHVQATLDAGSNGSYRLNVHSDALARDVWLSFGALDATLDDNAFDLLPGETRSIIVHSKGSLEALRKALAIQDLASVMAGAGKQQSH